MKKKIMFIIIPLIIIFIIAIPSIINYLFGLQYNENGISHWMVITIDKNQSKEYIGILDNCQIYVEKLKLDELNFRTIDAQNLPLKDAIDKKLTSLNEWRKYAWKIVKKENTEILKNDNYEIAITNDECIIRPITK